MPSILYHSNSSPPSRTVRMVAGILNVELELRLINPVLREQDTPELTKCEEVVSGRAFDQVIDHSTSLGWERGIQHRTGAHHPRIIYLTRKNPMRSVPLLDEGEFCLADSHAIIVYLLEKYGKPEHASLYPADSRKRATVHQRLFFECGILFPRLRTVMAPTFWGKLTELSKSMKLNIEDGYRTLEAYLSDTLYVADDVVTLADISIVTTVSTMDGIHPIDVKRYPKLKAWLHRMYEKDFCKAYNESGREELVTLLTTMMASNKHNQKSKL